ncbi:MAG TPA: transglycosylase family protein [Acidimicrobiales bacterium]|nr:transglycosylase family protein [Acidimicrobiales bacterium]
MDAERPDPQSTDPGPTDTEPTDSEPTDTERPDADAPGAASWLPGWWLRLDLQRRRLVAVGAVVVVVLGLGWALTRSGGDDAVTQPPSGADRFVASMSTSRVELWDRLAECESEGQWDLATGNGFFGGLQFTAESWDGVGGSGLPHQHTREEQILRAELLQGIQGFGAWPGCAAQLGLG